MSAQPLSADVSYETCANCGHGKKPRHGFVRCGLSPWQMSPEASPCNQHPVRWVPLTADLAAKRDAQAGIDAAVGAADQAIAGWSAVAFEYVKLYAMQHKGERYIGNDIVEASKVKGIIQPPNSKAWGGAIQRAARAKVIKRVGFAEDPNRHGNPVPLWESGE